MHPYLNLWVKELRAKADELISDVIDDLRYFLRKKDEPSQRRIIRSYGVTFKYLKGEPEEEIRKKKWNRLYSSYGKPQKIAFNRLDYTGLLKKLLKSKDFLVSCLEIRRVS
jgi:hypothetical protein